MAINTFIYIYDTAFSFSYKYLRALPHNTKEFPLVKAPFRLEVLHPPQRTPAGDAVNGTEEAGDADTLGEVGEEGAGNVEGLDGVDPAAVVGVATGDADDAAGVPHDRSRH